jgi:hypothetical protein
MQHDVHGEMGDHGRFQSGSSISRRGVTAHGPALLIRMSAPPRSAAVRWTIRRTWQDWETFAW